MEDLDRTIDDLKEINSNKDAIAAKFLQHHAEIVEALEFYKKWQEGKIEFAVKQILKELKAPENDVNYKETPKRVARMYAWFFRGYSMDLEREVEKILSKTFPSTLDQMIVTHGNATSLCPHHLLPIYYTFDVGIVPKGYVLGASKTERLFKLLCSVPTLQEDLTDLVAEKLQSSLKPKGVMVLVKGEHNCMRARGIENRDSVLITSAVRGVFREPEAPGLNPVQEFLSICKHRRYQ